MKFKILLVLLVFVGFFANANEQKLIENNQIQTKINDIGAEILNQNKITKRVVFVYDESEKKKNIEAYNSLKKRQVVVYSDIYKSIENDDELAAFIAREISYILKSYSGMWGGCIDSVQVALSSKKFEVVADKRAVDFMVKAGYNPLGMITFIHKTYPQKRMDKISRHVLTSKRLAYIYEYITYKYPEFIEENEYIDNKNYQNFLLTSVNNRLKLKEKIQTKSTKAVKYE